MDWFTDMLRDYFLSVFNADLIQFPIKSMKKFHWFES